MYREFKVVYVTPETFFNDDGSPTYIFGKLIADDMACVIVVDEAHLVAAWQSFRYVPLMLMQEFLSNYTNVHISS